MRHIAKLLSEMRDKLPIKDSTIKVALIDGRLRFTVGWIIDGKYYDWNREFLLHGDVDSFERPSMIIDMFIAEVSKKQKGGYYEPTLR